MEASISGSILGQPMLPSGPLLSASSFPSASWITNQGTPWFFAFGYLSCSAAPPGVFDVSTWSRTNSRASSGATSGRAFQASNTVHQPQPGEPNVRKTFFFDSFAVASASL